MGRSSKKRNLKHATTSSEGSFVMVDGGSYTFRNGVSVRELNLLPTEKFPDYIPPVELSEIHDDWMNDRSGEWLKHTPDDFVAYTYLKQFFYRYQEDCKVNPCDQYFHEWLENNCDRRFASWKENPWYCKQMKQTAKMLSAISGKDYSHWDRKVFSMKKKKSLRSSQEDLPFDQNP